MYRYRTKESANERGFATKIHGGSNAEKINKTRETLHHLDSLLEVTSVPTSEIVLCINLWERIYKPLPLKVKRLGSE